MLNSFRSMYQHRDLLFMWTLRDIQARYKQSFLGATWAILQPLVFVFAFTIVFSLFRNNVDTEGVPYPLFSYTAMLPWMFLASSITFGVPSLVQNMVLVSKIYFPREILPVSAVVAAFFDLIVASSIYLVILFAYRIPLQPSMIWIPVLLVIQTILVLGVVIPASALNVWYRDIRFLVAMGVQLWMYASPVIYSVNSVPEHLRSLYMLNPMATLIVSYRRVIIDGQPPDLKYLAISAGIALVLLIGGYIYFKRSEALFADVI